jgi:phosphatidate cytidylyltransferase
MSDKPKSSFFLRVASGIVLAPFVVYPLLVGGLAFKIFILVAVALALYEWSRMAMLLQKPVLTAFVGAMYILFCFGAFLYLGKIFGAGHVLCLVLAVWASDIGAYFAGKTFGGPKMAPSISPNKTWSGLVGGMLASGALIVSYALWIGPYLTSQMGKSMMVGEYNSVPALFAVGAGVTIAGQIGDLIESSQKRKSGLKDSSNLIPGHGGILDRIDALLLASPYFLLSMMALYA